MAPKFQPSLKLSEKLLLAISEWEIAALPSRLFHGCQSIDGSVNIEQMSLVGNKWFSTNEWYAGSYAWHLSRKGEPGPNKRYCLELTANDEYKVIVRPEHLKDFPSFLKSCFPQFGGYNLSRQFQGALGLHLAEVFGNNSSIIGYYWPDSGDATDEICVPECHKYLDVRKANLLPDDKQVFSKMYGERNKM